MFQAVAPVVPRDSTTDWTRRALHSPQLFNAPILLWELYFGREAQTTPTSVSRDQFSGFLKWALNCEEETRTKIMNIFGFGAPYPAALDIAGPFAASSVATSATHTSPDLDMVTLDKFARVYQLGFLSSFSGFVFEAKVTSAIEAVLSTLRVDGSQPTPIDCLKHIALALRNEACADLADVANSALAGGVNGWTGFLPRGIAERLLLDTTNPTPMIGRYLFRFSDSRACQVVLFYIATSTRVAHGYELAHEIINLNASRTKFVFSGTEYPSLFALVAAQKNSVFLKYPCTEATAVMSTDDRFAARVLTTTNTIRPETNMEILHQALRGSREGGYDKNLMQAALNAIRAINALHLINKSHGTPNDTLVHSIPREAPSAAAAVASDPPPCFKQFRFTGFHGIPSYDGALSRLSTADPGTYLLRVSQSKRGAFVLAFVDAARIVQQSIVSPNPRTASAVICSHKEFDSLKAMIDAYSRSPQNGVPPLLSAALAPTVQNGLDRVSVNELDFPGLTTHPACAPDQHTLPRVALNLLARASCQHHSSDDDNPYLQSLKEKLGHSLVTPVIYTQVLMALATDLQVMLLALDELLSKPRTDTIPPSDIEALRSQFEQDTLKDRIKNLLADASSSILCIASIADPETDRGAPSVTAAGAAPPASPVSTFKDCINGIKRYIKDHLTMDHFLSALKTPLRAAHLRESLCHHIATLDTAIDALTPRRAAASVCAPIVAAPSPEQTLNFLLRLQTPVAPAAAAAASSLGLGAAHAWAAAARTNTGFSRPTTVEDIKNALISPTAAIPPSIFESSSAAVLQDGLNEALMQSNQLILHTLAMLQDAFGARSESRLKLNAGTIIAVLTRAGDQPADPIIQLIVGSAAEKNAAMAACNGEPNLNIATVSAILAAQEMSAPTYASVFEGLAAAGAPHHPPCGDRSITGGPR